MKYSMMIAVFVSGLMARQTSYAGVRVKNGTADLGVTDTLTCSTGMTCSKDKFGVVYVKDNPTASTFTRFAQYIPASMTSGDAVAPGNSTTVYLSQLYLPVNSTLTGINVESATPCGTNKFIVALFTSAGIPVATSALAGQICAGTSAWQQIPFTSTYAAKVGAYWVGMYMDGTTDHYYALPPGASAAGLAGSSTGQAFGTVGTVAVPTFFTPSKGPIFFTY